MHFPLRVFIPGANQLQMQRVVYKGTLACSDLVIEDEF